MPERGNFLSGLRERYQSYEETVEELERNRKFGEGMFGIHIHKAGEASVQVDRWSAGCQVLARRADFLRMMELYDASAKLYGPRITYTLLTERDFG